MSTLAFLGLGGQEIWILVILVLVLFGGKKIPELMRGVGRGVGELQKGVEEGKRSLEKMKTLDSSNEDYKYPQDDEPVPSKVEEHRV